MKRLRLPGEENLLLLFADWVQNFIISVCDCRLTHKCDLFLVL